MFPSFFTRRRVAPTGAPAQFELGLDRTEAVRARLVRLGLPRVMSLTLTKNRAVVISTKGTALRMHEAFEAAPDDVLRAVVVFVAGKGVARRIARRTLVSYPIPRGDRGPRSREKPQAVDRPLIARLESEHSRLNVERFGGGLRTIPLQVSRRMRTRLGHYAAAASPGGAEIVINRRHIVRHGWDEAIDTLLHEMVHQWQDEAGVSIDHGPLFRQKAREVGVEPRAKRRVD